MRPENNFIIDEIKSRVDETPYVFVTEYTGMQVPQFAELRKRLSGAKAEHHVVKNTMLRHAMKDSELPDLTATWAARPPLSSAKATSARRRRC